MKLRFAFLAFGLLNLLALTGCNGIGDKDSILARIDQETVYREDLVLLMKNSLNSGKDLETQLYNELYAKEAVVSKAMTAYPELQRKWDDYFKEGEVNLLSNVYQRFYMNERLMYTDAELRQFYNGHSDLFKDAPLPDFGVIQGVVACEYYMSQHKDSLDAFLKANLRGSKSSADSVRLKTQFVENYRTALRGQIAKNLAKELHIEYHEPEQPEPKAFYEKHKELFMTQPGYELYHIQESDSLALLALVEGVATLEQFKSVAAARSLNAETAKDSGYVGYVKKDFALPYGIGMVADLSAAVDGRDAGFITPVLKAGQNGGYHVFYLAAKVAPKQKEFERVAESIKIGIANKVYFDMDSSFVLMSRNGKSLLTAGELERICREKLFAELNGRTFRRLFAFVSEKYLYSEAARSQKLEKTWEYRALKRSAYRNFIYDNFFYRHFDDIKVSEDSIKAFYELYGNPVHPGKSLDSSKNEVRAAALFPMNIFKHEYFVRKNKSYVGMDFAKSVHDLFINNWREQNDMANARFAAETFMDATLHYYDSSIPEGKPEILSDRLLFKADSMNKAGNVNGALEAYRNLMFAYGENDSLFKIAGYESAQILNDAGRFEEAEAEYRAFCEMFPESPNAEKALFSLGFVLHENLKKNEEAKAVFEEFQRIYPNSELKESVEWLVKNIESNGKLAEDLMKKIETQE